jgi:CHASE2 domain-containing sensor protein
MKQQDDSNALNQVVAIQEKTLEVKSKETDVKAQEISANKEIALATIAAQKETQMAWNEKFWKSRTNLHWFIFVIVIAVCAFLISMAWFVGKDFVLKLVEEVVPPVVTAIGGYYYGKSKPHKNE